MATCKKCGKTIPEGFEYCSDCSANNKADESYLDSLLSSVSANTTNPLASKMQTTHSTASPVKSKFLASSEAKKEAEKFEDSVYEELNDANRSIENNGKYDILSITDEDYLDKLFEEDKTDIFSNEEELEAAIKADAAAGSEPVSEADFMDDLLRAVDENAAAEAENPDEAPAEDPLSALNEAFALAEEMEGTTSTTEVEPSNDIDFFGALAQVEAEKDEETETEVELEPLAEVEETVVPEQPAAPEVFAEDPELTFAEIPGMESTDAPDLGAASTEEEIEKSEKTSKVTLVEQEGKEGGDEDILEFWNNLNGDENGSDGGPGPVAAKEEATEEKEEALTDQDELAALLAGLPEIDDGGLDIPDKSEPKEIELPEGSEEKPKKKKSFWVRIFGNVKEDISDEEREARKQAALEKLEADQTAAEAKKAQQAEEKAAAKAEADEIKKAKKAQQEEEKKLKAEQKKAAKDKKLAARKALLEELDDDDGKINKIGASLIFLVFAIILCFIAVGTSVYTYRVAIANAENHFEQDKYDEAYQDIYGIDVKEEDQLLYDQIMTVQYVNTQLLSYLKYTGLEMDNEALDSLLKGLRRYEKYIAYAKELHVEEDLNYLRTQILDELLDKYGLSEAQAYEIINSVTQEAYSKSVREVVQKLKDESNGEL